MPMPKPKEKEKEADFVSRFMGDAEMLKDYPDEKQRAAVAYKTFRGENQLENAADWPVLWKFDFIEPGLVYYAHLNNGQGATLLIRYPVLAKINDSMVGKPIIDVNHRDVNPECYKNGEADGIVTRVFYNADTGMFAGEALVWGEEAKRHIAQGWRNSCAVVPKRISEVAGLHNNVSYDGEVLDAEYEHLAIVKEPRYERTRFYNSKQGGRLMGLIKFLKKLADGKDEQVSAEVDPSKVDVEYAGKKTTLANALEIVNRYEEEQALKNSALTDDTLIEIRPGVKRTYKDIKISLQNAAEEEDEEKKKKEKEKMENDMISDHKDGKHDGKEGEYKNCAMCNKKMHNDKELADKAARERQDKLDNAARNRKGDVPFAEPTFGSTESGLKRGQERYGRAPVKK